MKRSPNNNLAAKSQKRPRRLLDKAQSNTTPPPLLNLAADALVRAGGKSSTMKNLNYPNKLVNIVDKFERQKAIRDIGPHVRRHLNRYFSGNDKADRGTLSLKKELMGYNAMDKGYIENGIKKYLQNSLLKLDSNNYTPNKKNEF